MNKKHSSLIVSLLFVVSFAPFAPGVSALHSSLTGRLAEGGIAGRALTVQLAISDSQAYAIATDALSAYFRDVIMQTQVFKDTYGDIAWEDYSEEVVESIDIVRDRKMENTRYADTQYAFNGWIFDMYAEIAIDKATGEIRKVVIELF